MAEKKQWNERVFTIPLREAFKKSERRRTPYAMRLVKSFLEQHTKAEQIKIGRHLNHEIWKGKKPPRRVRVKAVKVGSVIKAELMGFDYEDFAAQPKTEKLGMKERLLSRLGPKAIKKEQEEKMAEGKAGAEAKEEVKTEQNK